VARDAADAAWRAANEQLFNDDQLVDLAREELARCLAG
jgi:hypothetical protein